jgi:2-dehydropantoate 2-reductase
VIKGSAVLPACVYVGTHIERPGKILQKGGACRILFGLDPPRPGFATTDIVELFQQAIIKSEWTPEIQAEICKKFIFICAFGLVTAAYDRALGEILNDDALKGEARAIMNEVVSLAKASGIALPADIVETSLAKAKSFPFEAKTSFQRDFERMDKRDERDLSMGTLIRMGDELGVDVPTTHSTSAILSRRKPTLPTSGK